MFGLRVLGVGSFFRLSVVVADLCGEGDCECDREGEPYGVGVYLGGHGWGVQREARSFAEAMCRRIWMMYSTEARCVGSRGSSRFIAGTPY